MIKFLKINRDFILLLIILISTSFKADSQDHVLKLWPDKIPNQRTTLEKEKSVQKEILVLSNVQDPLIEVFLPAKKYATGEAILIFPGGGYHVLAYDWEGTDIAKWLNSMGIAGIVCKYRLPKSPSILEPWKAPLQDAQRAMRLVKAHASEWEIETSKIGIMGFSAGGHLASTLGTHFNEEIYKPIDMTDTISARPQFMVLMYPVVSFNAEVAHLGSRNALIGAEPDPNLIAHFSNELQVNSNTPPTFLIHAGDDKSVSVENSLLFYNALRKNDVPVEMHIYPTGGHGFSLALNDDHLGSWKMLLRGWLRGL